MNDQTEKPEITPIWDKTVFAQFKNSKLKKVLIKWAKKHQLYIVWGNPKHPDIIACPSFVQVIDRTLIIENQIYFQYIDFVNEVNPDCEFWESRDVSICIIIDNIKDIELPLLDVVIQIDINQKNAAKWIIHNLELASKLFTGTAAKHLNALGKETDKYIKNLDSTNKRKSQELI